MGKTEERRGKPARAFVRGMSIFCALAPLCLGVLAAYAQDDYLEVRGDTKADSIDFDTFVTDTGGKPSAPDEGEVFYDFEAGKKQPYYYDGTWRAFGGGGGGGPKTVATKIVAASNSLDKTKADHICDGTADQVEIQTAINELGANGGAVYLLEGTYSINGPINLDNTAPDDSNKAIIGAGSGTELKAAGAIDIFNCSNVSGILISNLRLNSNGVGTGILFSDLTNSNINKVWVENLGQGIHLRGSSDNNTLSGNNIQNNDGNGIWLSSSNNTLSGNNIQNNGTGIWLPSSDNNTLSGNNIQNNDTYGILLAISTNNTLSGNNIQNNGVYGILFASSDNNTLSGNNIQNNDRYGIVLSSSDNNTLSGNISQGNGYDGILLKSSSGNAIFGNLINDSGSTSNYDGISIENDSNNNLISGNRIFDSAPTGSANTNYGIYIGDNTCDDNYLSANLIDGAGYVGAGFDRRINDSGTQTKYTDKIKMTLEKRQIGGTGNYNLNVANNPRSYISFNPTGAITLTLANGRAPGDLLILENIHASNLVSLSEAANVNLGVNPRQLGQYHTLELIWNGTVAQGGTGKWLEVNYADN